MLVVGFRCTFGRYGTCCVPYTNQCSLIPGTGHLLCVLKTPGNVLLNRGHKEHNHGVCSIGIRDVRWCFVQNGASQAPYPPCVFLGAPKARTCMSSALRDVLCACYESGGTDEATGSQLAPKMQVCRVVPSPRVGCTTRWILQKSGRAL